MAAAGGEIDTVDQVFIIEDASATYASNGGGTAYPGATLFQGSVSIINILLGVGILSMPYAMRSAGAAGVLSVFVCCFLFCTTGKFIHWGLDLIPANAPRNYPGLGEAAMGALGRSMVSVAAAAELFGAACMMLIIMWRSIEQLLTQALDGSGTPPGLAHTAAILLGIAVQGPLCVLGSYRTVAGFSTAGCVSTGAVMALVLFLPILDPHKLHLDEAPSHRVISIDIIPASSIFALGVAGHSAFPSVRASMASTRQFSTALNVAYVACAVATGVVCGVGYWYWGDSAHVLVTTDFERHSPYGAFTLRGWGIQSAVEVLIALNVGTTVPLFVFALTDILQASIGRDQAGSATIRRPAMGARAALTGVIIITAWLLQNVLGAVESLFGAVCVIASSALLPTLFYAALRRKKGIMRVRDWAASAAIFAFGTGLMAVVLAQTGYKLASWAAGGGGGPEDAGNGLQAMGAWAGAEEGVLPLDGLESLLIGD
eukprot:jgi/Ulvmu1/6395/UM003_0023.1